MKHKGKTNPPGRIKIIKSFSRLMEEKDFHSITTAEIAGNAGVTEGLIYKYFKDKKDLLYQVLTLFFQKFLEKIQKDAGQKDTSVEKLEAIIFASLESYAANRVFARILLLEVRNSSVYFDSCAYKMVTKYAGIILGIIREGVENGELKPKTDPYLLRKVILGAIEHACLGEVIFDRELNVETVSRGIANIVFNGAKA